MNDYEVDAKKSGITDGSVAIGTPRHIDVSSISNRSSELILNED